MRRGILLAIVVVSSVGCAFDRHRADRPARLLLGTNARDLSGSEDAEIALRAASPSEAAPVPQDAYTLAAQFTMATKLGAYGGFELETGRMDTRGSNFAGGYGVLGAEHAWRSAAVGVELVTGWRGLRLGHGVEDVNNLVTEPRLRGQLRLAPQLTVGAVAGATFGERGSWMTGLYLGFHSRAFGQ